MTYRMGLRSTRNLYELKVGQENSRNHSKALPHIDRKIQKLAYNPQCNETSKTVTDQKKTEEEIQQKEDNRKQKKSRRKNRNSKIEILVLSFRLVI